MLLQALRMDVAQAYSAHGCDMSSDTTDPSAVGPRSPTATFQANVARLRFTVTPVEWFILTDVDRI